MFIDTEQATKNLKDTGEQSKKLTDRLADGAKTAGKWATGLYGFATTVGTAMIGASKKVAENADAIDKASQRMGISAESYQELAHAAELSGVDMGVLEDAAKKVAQNFEDMDVNDALDQLMAISDEGERASAAYEMFGESAYKLTPLLNAGADGLADMKQEAHDLGLVMGEDAVKDGAAMNDMFAKVGDSLTGLKNSLMTEMMPYVMDVLDWIIQNIPKALDTIKKVMDKIMPIVKPILQAASDAVKSVIDLINGDFSSFGEHILGVFRNLGKGLLEAGKTALKFLLDGFKSAWDGIVSWIGEKIEWIKSKFSLKNIVSGIFGGDDDEDGSHASGLSYVPYDGYKAELHRGEMVLNAQNTGDLMAAINSLTSAIQSGGFGGAQNIYLDTGALVGSVSPQLDTALGINYAFNKRGALA